MNLADDVEHPEKGNQNNMMEAKTYYLKAQGAFSQYGQWERV
ncbi:hypothetical protein [cyanobacterium endosymbiont of Epithemia turgida]|nr:hypothetical protein [cyanobacterium endosymbiont of Epithemia turgida]BAP17292.1 hypothetical protein ETSB_0435 [cyanobacterium endosymbiont of Epithemia turgida isolate EtSB Lake Yunoko]